MGSSTTSQKARESAPHGQQIDWPVFVCRHGIFLFDPNAFFPVDPREVLGDQVKANPRAGEVVLPPCRDRDKILDQPPLGLRLSSEEAKDLVADTIGAAGVAAATDFGSELQEKGSNQDFALAATIRIPRPNRGPAVYQFAAVADGVTTRTFWPERSARLAVLVAWRVARAHVKANRGFDEDGVKALHQALVDGLRMALLDDRAAIATEDGITPAGWARDTYLQNRHRPELWYNSTLLVALVGEDGGLVATCGDGGVVYRKTEDGVTKTSVLVRSTDDVTVSGVVSLSSGALQFQPRRIVLAPQTKIEIVMSSDGVDRSLRRAAELESDDTDPYGNEFPSDSSQNLARRLTNRLDGIPDREVDNVSIAVLCWPARGSNLYAVPRFQKSITTRGEYSVDGINLRAERRYKPTEPRYKSPRMPMPTAVPATSPEVADAPRSLRAVAARVEHLPRASELPPLPDLPNKWGHHGNSASGVQKPAEHRAESSSGGSSTTETEIDAEKIQFRIKLIVAVRGTLSLISNSDALRREIANHRWVSRIRGFGDRDSADCGKFVFFVLAKTWAYPDFVGAMSDDDVDNQVDQIVRDRLGYSPRLRARQIRDSEIPELTEDLFRVFDIISSAARRSGISDRQLQDLEESFKQLRCAPEDRRLNNS